MEVVPEKLSDEELVAHSLINPDFFGYIIDRYETKLDRYIKRISAANAEDRQDILQDIFIAVYQNLNAYNKSMKFSSWLYRIAHNRTVSWWRKNKHSSRDVSIENNLEFVESLFNQNDIQLTIDQKHLNKIIEHAFSRMKDEYKDLLILKFVEGLSYEELADTFGCSVGTIGTRIARAKKQFINFYQEYENKR